MMTRTMLHAARMRNALQQDREQGPCSMRLHLRSRTPLAQNGSVECCTSPHSARVSAVNATISDCTLPEKILLAASTLEERGTVPFTAEALIVAVWERYPQSFGLKGFEERHPDSNKVLSALMGEKGLAKRGWLHKAGQK